MVCDLCNDVTLTPRSFGRRRWFKICKSCYFVAKILLWFIHLNPKTATPRIFRTIKLLYVRFFSCRNSSKELKRVVARVNEKIKRDYDVDGKIEIIISSLDIYRDNNHYDIFVRPSDYGTRIPAHRALLASRSEIMKIMLTSDSCMIAATDTITFPDLNRDVLQSLIDFLYSGTLSRERLEKHARALSIAADKYEIASLRKFCEHWLIENLNSSNVLEDLEASDLCSNEALKETAIDFVIENMQAVVFTPSFRDFARENPYLAEEISRVYERSNNGVPMESYNSFYNTDENTVDDSTS